MIGNDVYQQITKDIAGSRTKNRFSYEMCYGIVKIYELYKDPQKRDFFVIFDYACDIEASIDDSIAFYQLKSRFGSNFTLNNLLSTPKGKKSILQTLVDLKKSPYVSGLSVVSNARLSGAKVVQVTPLGKTTINSETLLNVPFDQLDDQCKDLINSNLTWPMGQPSLNSVSFRVADLSVNDAPASLLDETNKFLNFIYGEGTPKIPDRFQECLISKVYDRACYECNTLTLEDAIRSKGITKSDIDETLKTYSADVINSQIPSFNKISINLNCLTCFDVQTKLRIKNAYHQVFGTGSLGELERKIINDIRSKIADDPKFKGLDENSVVKLILESFDFGDLNFDEDIKGLLVVSALAL